MSLILGILGIVLVIFGVAALVQGSILWGVILIVVGLVLIGYRGGITL